MISKQELSGAVIKIIEHQMKKNQPKETKITFNRLVESGITPMNAKKYIGQCVAVEIQDILTNQVPFNEQRYVENLKKLPQEPVG